jgi:hypothetical protein
MTTSQDEYTLTEALAEAHGIRLGETRKAVVPVPVGWRSPIELTPAERIRHWYATHGSNGVTKPGRKPAESVYAVRIWSNPRFIKIGRSGRTGARFDIIRTSTPFYLEVLMDVLVKDSEIAEVALQREFADHCVSGEWFHFDEATESEVAATLKSCVMPLGSVGEVMS